MRKLFLISVFIFPAFSASAQLWDSLRGGLGNSPRVMYADTVDNYLYAAGMFHQVDGMHCKGIARWNGTQWDSLGAGIEGMDTVGTWPPNTYALARYNGDLYAGGVFNSAGSLEARRLARWDGMQWDSLDVQPFSFNSNTSILCLAAINGCLYIGGTFDSVAHFPCRNIARWNGASWTGLNFPSFPFGGSVNAIAEYNGEIYAAGNFHQTLGDTISNILKWDGSAWRSVGGGIKGSSAGIETMAVYNGELYVAGAFYMADGNATDNIQKWNGTTWSGVGGGTNGSNGQIHKLVVFNNKLYALGVFNEAGGIPANYFAFWDGVNWCGVGSFFSNVLLSGCVYNDSLYIGGGFNTIDADSFAGIAQWIGGNFALACGNTTALDEISSSSAVSVYPNPTSGETTFQFSNITGHEVIHLYDGLGREVWSQSVNGSSAVFNAAEYSPGLYYYRMEQDGNIAASGKIVIQ